MTAKYYDENGYEVKFEDETPEDEKKEFLRIFSTVDAVAERRVHCTSCNKHIGTAPIAEATIRMHPVLRVTICRNCFTFYNSGEFTKGEDGSELYCRWCGQGGEVYCCSSCCYVFCKKCIIQNLSRSVIQDIEKTDNWNCFACEPKILLYLRALYWALTNYLEKQIKEINDRNLEEEEINTLMSKDRSICCNFKKKPVERKSIEPTKSGEKSKPKTYSGIKRPAEGGQNGSAHKKLVMNRGPGGNMSKVIPASAFLVGNTQATPMSAKGAAAASGAGAKKNANEVVCTPDIMSMFEEHDDDGPSTSGAGPRPGAAQPPPPLVTINSSISATPPMPTLSVRPFARMQPLAPRIQGPHMPPPQSMAPMVINNQMYAQQPQLVTQPGGPHTPVYHTINGFRIDLNSAAQQDTFRLPNGKLIQVKKQIPPSPRMPTAGPSPRQTYVSVKYTNANRILNGGAPPVRINVPHAATPVMQPPQITRVAPTVQQMQQHQQQQQQGLPLKPPPMNLQKPSHPNTPLGSARNAFETKVYSGLEICHQIIGKINTLTNNSSYKDVRHYKDLKELYIHLTYLLTYAIGRFKSVQDKCNEELQKLGFATAAEERKESDEGGDDDLEIVEQQTPCIELDSDDEGTVEKEKDKEEEVPDPDKDPKLKLKVSVAINRAETIIPSVGELLEALKNAPEEPEKGVESVTVDSDEEGTSPAQKKSEGEASDQPKAAEEGESVKSDEKQSEGEEKAEETSEKPMEEVSDEAKKDEEVATEPKKDEGVAVEDKKNEEVATEPKNDEEVAAEPKNDEEVAAEPKKNEEVSKEPEIDAEKEKEGSEEVDKATENEEDVSMEPEVVPEEAEKPSETSEKEKEVSKDTEVTSNEPEKASEEKVDSDAPIEIPDEVNLISEDQIEISDDETSNSEAQKEVPEEEKEPSKDDEPIFKESEPELIDEPMETDQNDSEIDPLAASPQNPTPTDEIDESEQMDTSAAPEEAPKPASPLPEVQESDPEPVPETPTPTEDPLDDLNDASDAIFSEIDSALQEEAAKAAAAVETDTERSNPRPTSAGTVQISDLISEIEEAAAKTSGADLDDDEADILNQLSEGILEDEWNGLLEADSGGVDGVEEKTGE